MRAERAFVSMWQLSHTRLRLGVGDDVEASDERLSPTRNDVCATWARRLARETGAGARQERGPVVIPLCVSLCVEYCSINAICIAYRLFQRLLSYRRVMTMFHSNF